MNRLQVISRQFTAVSEKSDVGGSLSQLLVHDNADLRRAIFEFLKDDIYTPNYDLSLAEFRELTLQRIIKFASQNFFSVRDYMNDPRKFMAALECLSYVDFSMGIKSGVHFTLCGGSICRLGTQKHHDALLDKIDTLALPGSYCMTELGHGTNVFGIETRADYDARARQFIISTPSNTASKYWIGGAGQHAKVSVVFAQLYVGGKYEGVNAFVVRLRDDAGKIMPGVRIHDIGHKMGLNGIDNGQVWFDNVRVPRDGLLDRYGTIDDNDNYVSPIESVSKRFGAMIGGLTTGRVLIAQGCIDAMKMGLTIAIRYSADRPQFGDTRIMDYLTHQRDLLPALAETYALHIAMGDLKTLIDKASSDSDKDVHIMSCGLKAVASWSAIDTLHKCREACGGMGFHSLNKIPELIKDSHITSTFEGSNPALMQQVAKSVMEGTNATERIMISSMMLDKTGINAFNMLEILRQRRALLTKEAVSFQGTSTAITLLLNKLGWAHVEHMCMQSLISKAKIANGPLKQTLLEVATLYGTSIVEKHAAFFLMNGILDRNGVVLVSGCIDGICSKWGSNGARPALSLCDAFRIPDHLIRAPIAFDWRQM
jgi:acyl-CoA oxidase